MAAKGGHIDFMFLAPPPPPGRWIRCCQDTKRYKYKKYTLASTSLDIGIKPAADLRPRKLRAEDAIEDFKGPPQPNAHFKLLS